MYECVCVLLCMYVLPYITLHVHTWVGNIVISIPSSLHTWGFLLLVRKIWDFFVIIVCSSILILLLQLQLPCHGRLYIIYIYLQHLLNVVQYLRVPVCHVENGIFIFGKLFKVGKLKCYDIIWYRSVTLHTELKKQKADTTTTASQSDCFLSRKTCLTWPSYSLTKHLNRCLNNPWGDFPPVFVCTCLTTAMVLDSFLPTSFQCYEFFEC